MSTDKDIDTSSLQVFEQLFSLLGRACPRQVIHPDGKIPQPVVESLEMLKSQYCCRHEHCHLFRVACRLECCSHSHFRFSKSHIPTDESVHRPRAFHVAFHIIGCRQLVGCILIKEACLEFVLHIIVRTESEAFFSASPCIQFDEVACDLLDFVLGPLLHSFPGSSSESAQSGWLSVSAASVFGYFV